MTDPNSPLDPAATTNRCLKLILWANSGAGKSRLDLRFLFPAVIDLEGGTEHYGVTRLEDLTEENAQIIIKKFENVAADKTTAQHPK